MPLNIPDNLPAVEQLINENIFVMRETRAKHQDIRPLQIALLNLMPVKTTTETHILRMLSNTPIQVEVSLIRTSSYESKTTAREHMEAFYKTFTEVKHRKFDGMIITGAPIEQMEFEEVDYWEEMVTIMDWANTHVTSTLFICWGAQAGLYHHYGIPKYELPAKMFGVFCHRVLNKREPIVRGFDDMFLAPHSRHTCNKAEDIQKVPELELIAESDEAGVYLVISKDGKRVFVTGHSEYDPDTLKNEYLRDLNNGLTIEKPKNYFKDEDPSKEPVVRWKSHANLLFSNWLNYYVYQITPFDLGYG